MILSSFLIHLDVSVTAHRASPLNPAQILSLHLVTRYFIGCTQRIVGDGTEMSRMGCTAAHREALRDESGHLSISGLEVGLCVDLYVRVCAPNLRPVLVKDFPGSAASLCPSKPRRLQAMLSLMINLWN